MHKKESRHEKSTIDCYDDADIVSKISGLKTEEQKTAKIRIMLALMHECGITMKPVAQKNKPIFHCVGGDLAQSEQHLNQKYNPFNRSN